MDHANRIPGLIAAVVGAGLNTFKLRLWERNYQYPARLARSAVFNLSDEPTTRSTWSAASGRIPCQQVGVFLAQGQIQSSGAPTEAGTCSLPSFCLHLGLTDGRLCTRQTVHAPNGNGLCQSCWMLGCSPIRGACNCCSLFSTYLTLDLIKLNHHESSLFSDQLTVN